MNASLNESRSLDAIKATERLVTWHIFRDLFQAEDFAGNIMLGDGQHITGGQDLDSIGPVWWVGVVVDDLEHWGNLAAVNKHAA